MPAKKKRKRNGNNHKRNLIEITKGKPRQEEEKFFIGFSGRQLNAVLLILLTATFLVQGITRYLEIIGKESALGHWFFIIVVAILFLASSVFFIVLSGVFSLLKMKRVLNFISFFAFLIGFLLFIASLLYLFVII